jgi:hypothetical protein
MIRLLGKAIGMIISIVMIPIILILAIPMGIVKARQAQKSMLLFTGNEQTLLAKAQQTISMAANGLMSPDRDLLEAARCIENSRRDYQTIKSRERFDQSFSDFVIPRVRNCQVRDWKNVIRFFDFSEFEQFKKIEAESEVDGLLHNNSRAEILITNKGMRLEEAGVDILSIVCNNEVVYLNPDVDHLFITDNDGDEKMDGRVVNVVFSGQTDGDDVEVFVVFDDSDSYTMFTLQAGMMERLNFVAQAILKYFSEVGIKNVFSDTERYTTQYFYTFKAYRKNEKYFLVNNAQTQAYLIDNSRIMRDDVAEIKNIFWNSYSASNAATFINSKGEVAPITGRQIEPDSRSLDGPGFREKLNEFSAVLHKLSAQPTQKTCRMSIIPCDGSFWSWDFEFSDEEKKLAQDVVSKLYDYTQGWIQASTFGIRKSADQVEVDDDIPF